MEMFSGVDVGIDDTRKYSMKEVVDLIQEVTPEIEAFMNKMFIEMAMKEAMENKKSVEVEDMPDQEKDRVILCEVATKREVTSLEILDWYVKYKERKAPLQLGYEMRYRLPLDEAFLNLNEVNSGLWKEYDSFVKKLEKRMLEIEPTPAQWEKAMAMKSLIFTRTVCARQEIEIKARDLEKQDKGLGKVYKARLGKLPYFCKTCTACKNWDQVGYAVWSKRVSPALEAYNQFWLSPAGQKLSALNKKCNYLWRIIEDCEIDWTLYNSLVETEYSENTTELNPYFTSGDTEEVDTMEMMAHTLYERLDDMENASHSEDAEADAPQSNGPALWDWKEAAKSYYEAKAKADAEVAEAQYQASLMSFMDEYLCGPTDTHSSANGVYTA